MPGTVLGPSNPSLVFMRGLVGKWIMVADVRLRAEAVRSLRRFTEHATPSG